MTNTLLIEELNTPDYERVVYGEDKNSGLRAIVAVHNTNRGPACGGVRMLPYQTKDEALYDVLRLAKGMTYKSALADIGFGGGKAVIIGDESHKSPELFKAFGQLVNHLEGRYIAAKDMNITNADLLEIRKISPHVLGLDIPGSSGDPSPVTARGLVRALEATMEEMTGKKDFKGIKVAIQGVGYVGYEFGRVVHQRGGRVVVTDIDPKLVTKAKTDLAAEVVSHDEIYDVECDIFAPCARGAILNSQTIPRLKCKAIVGCANNQLETPNDGVALFERKILYAPDFAINSGGIINIFAEVGGYERDKAFAKADGIYKTMCEIFMRARKENTPPFVVADRLAEERIREKV